MAAVKIPSSLESVMVDLLGKPLRWEPLEKPFVLKMSYATLNFGVEASNNEEAEKKALELARNTS